MRVLSEMNASHIGSDNVWLVTDAYVIFVNGIIITFLKILGMANRSSLKWD